MQKKYKYDIIVKIQFITNINMSKSIICGIKFLQLTKKEFD